VNKSLKKFAGINFAFYLTIGGLTAFLCLGLIFVTVEYLGFQYQLGVSFSYFLATLFHFVANKKLTFHAVEGSLTHQVPRYLGVIVLHYLTVLATVSVLVSVFGLSVYISSAVAILLASGVGYILMRFWVFRGVE
jgi:putative flippase GtrA